MAHRYPALDRAIEIGGVSARNRIMMSTHGPRLGQARYARYLEERARGGIGLAGFNLGPLGVMSFPFGPGRPTPNFSFAEGDGVPPHPLTAEGRAYYDSLIPAVREWAEAVKPHGVRSVGQLYHPGAAQHSDSFMPIVSASAVVDDYERHRPHVLTGTEIADLIQTYGESGKRVLAAGYELIEIHAAHGYLVEQFLSPLLNHRDDDWGGSFDKRVRFLTEVIRAVRAGIDDALPVGVRLTGYEPEGGLTTEDIAAIAVAAEAAGAAYISLSSGTYSGLWRGADRAYVASALAGPAPNVPAAAAVKRAVGIPVMVGGSIATMDRAEAIIGGGGADIVCMVRALMAEPRLVAKAFAGDTAARPCIGGNECHYGRPVACAVNPATGREAAMEPLPAPTPRRILIIGGGPAGMECALAAAGRGHDVVLAERADTLGGALRALRTISEQARFGDYIDYTVKRIRAAAIDVRSGVDADANFARGLAPDAIVLATGAIWPAARDPWTALCEPGAAGSHIAVVGGLDDHLPPLIAADWLARRGHRVTLVTEIATPGQAVEPASLYVLLRRLHERGVAILPFTAAAGFDNGVMRTRNTLTGSVGTLSGVDKPIDVGARTSDAKGLEMFAALAPDVRVIGDALSPRRMLHATLDGARLGLAL